MATASVSLYTRSGPKVEVQRTSFVQGASRGIGLEFVRQLLATDRDSRVFASCRDPSGATELAELASQHPARLKVIALDVSKEQTIIRAAESLRHEADELHLVLNASGVLHGPDFVPEKKLAQVKTEVLRAAFEVNAFGPLVVAKHFHGFLRHRRRSVFASLSARVGSISDNRLGGWYSYRGSKAAQNMFTKTLSIELARVAPQAIVVGLHPGTVDTDLSKPFQRNLPKAQLLAPSSSVASLLEVIAGLRPEDTGKVFDFRGEEVFP